MSAPYGNKAQEQWNSEWLGKGTAKAKAVSSLVGTTNGQFDPEKTNAFDLDYLTENLDDDFRNRHTPEARQFAGQMMRSMMRAERQ